MPVFRSARLTAATVLLLALTLSCLVPGARGSSPTPGGTMPEEARQAFGAGLFDLPASPGAGPASAVGGIAAWRVPVIMVAYADEPLAYGAATFDSALFDTTGAMATGSVYDYYQWASGGRMKVVGKVVAVVTLPHTRHYYGDFSYGLAFTDSPNNMYGVLVDALNLCQATVDWSLFDRDRDGYVDMLWVLHQGEGGETSADKDDLWSITSRMSAGWRNGVSYVTTQQVAGATSLYYRVDRFSTVPELSGFRPGRHCEIGAFCHEFGHAIGLPDLYDTSSLGGAGNVGPGNWSLMATGGYGTNGISPETPGHLGGWCSVFLGWRQPVRLARDTTLTLAPLGEGGDVVELWYQGDYSPEHFLLEARARRDYDRHVQYEGLLITHLDETAIGQRIASNRVNAGATPGLWVVEADGDSDLVLGRNRGDAYDVFPGLGGTFQFGEDTRPNTDTFQGAPTNVSLQDITWTGTGSHFTAHVRAAGWQDPADFTPATFAPLESAANGQAAERDASGALWFVKSEIVGGRPQVVLHQRRGLAWQPPQVLSSAPVAALDPAIAALANGDLAVAWSDTRSGHARIVYRARIRGNWTAEALVGDRPGENLGPSIGLDEQGRLHLAWLNLFNDAPTVYFTRFLYASPFGQSVAVTGPGDLPGYPAVAVHRSTGRSFLMWADRAAPFQRLWISRFAPDSGVIAPIPLTPLPTSSQSAFAAAVDTAGTLHVAWGTSGGSQREIHYQRRLKTQKPSPRDTIIETISTPAQSFALAVDPSLTVHLAYETAPASSPHVYYKRRRPAQNWDLLSTEISQPGLESGARPALVAESSGNVAVMFTGSSGGTPRLYQRERVLDPRPLTAVEPAGAPPANALRLGPNPLRAGEALALEWSGEASDAVDLFDLAGRRVASATLVAAGDRFVARLDARALGTLPAGVVFARVRGRSAPATRLVILH